MSADIETIQNKLQDLWNREISMDKLVKQLIFNEPLFNDYLNVAMTNIQPCAWRAAWLIDHYTDSQIKTFIPYTDLIINKLDSFENEGQKRAFLKIFTKYDIKSDYLGKLIDLCFKFLYSKKSSAAVKVHAMQIIFNISEKEKDLKNELIIAIQDVFPDLSIGCKNRAEKLLTKLSYESKTLSKC